MVVMSNSELLHQFVGNLLKASLHGLADTELSMNHGHPKDTPFGEVSDVAESCVTDSGIVQSVCCAQFPKNIIE